MPGIFLLALGVGGKVELVSAGLMKSVIRPFCVAISSLALTLSAQLSGSIERSVSPSRQFIVYGTDAPLRGAIANVAEHAKAHLLTLLQQRDDWKTPIVLNLQFPQANLPENPSAALYFSQTGSGLKLQLDLTIGADLSAPGIKRELLRAIVLEMIYRKQPDLAPGTPYVQPPDWLLDGLLASAPGQERAPLVGAMTSLAWPNQMVTLEKFLRQKPEQLDSPSRMLYRAYSLAFLQLLVDGPNGRAQLARYIDNLSHASNDPLADLREQFPVLAQDDFEQIWKSSVANLSRAYQPLTFIETAQRLDELLKIPVGIGKISRLEDFLAAKITSPQAAVLNHLGQNLMLLSASANPVMRPIVVEYQQIVQLTAAGKRGGLRERLARLKVTRAKLAARMTKVDDYMNWFEATQLNSKSGAFTDYLRAAGATRDPEPRRHDALSVYLDALEEQFQN